MGTHGRDSAIRTFLFLLAWGAAVSAQTSFPYQDLAPGLAARIASVLLPGAQVSLTPSSETTSETESGNIAAFQADLAARLTARGVRVAAEGDGVTAIRFGCRQNLRERSCVAEIRSAGARDRVMVTGAHDGPSRQEDAAWFSLDVRPLFVQRVQLLDLAILGDRLLVLDVQSLSLYRRTADAWQPLESRPLAVGRTWPRDPRGRLRIAGDRFEAWLPGLVCTGAAAPLAFTCTGEQRPWPVGIDNGGLAPGRNHFATPEGLPFYSAAPLGNAAEARWLIAEPDGALTWLDATRRAVGRAGVADDIAALAPACRADTTIMAVEHTPGTDSDALRTFQAISGRLVPAASPMALPGIVTALWSTPGADAATLIVHDRGAARYEALQIRVACGR